MIVLVVTACPEGLRGDLTRWLLEISPGTFVGNVSAKVREALWERTCSYAGSGRAILVYSSDSEQRLRFKVHKHDWEPVDLEGLTLMMRPLPGSQAKSKRSTGWSKARAQVRSRNPSWRIKM